MEVSKVEIVHVIKKYGYTTIREVQKKTSAGRGCGGCLKKIESILIEVNGLQGDQNNELNK